MENKGYRQIELTKSEQEILRGSSGAVMQKVMETVVRYGEALNAPRLVEITGPGHLVIPWAIPGICPPLELLEELVEAGLKTTFPFTLDPRPPLDFENLGLDSEVECTIRRMHKDQERYDELMQKLGLRDQQAYSCYPYLREVGNIPKRDAVLAWSESACAIYANSVLAARTNRNGAIIDLIQNIAGKTPYTGLITDQGRLANYIVEIKSAFLPNPHLLGAAIGKYVLSGVPFLSGLDCFLSPEIDPVTSDYLQDLGAALATYSAVSLFHVENITPEARDAGRDLVLEKARTITIEEADLDLLAASYPVLWQEVGATPEVCYVGCPHLSLYQLEWWADQINRELEVQKKGRLAIEAVFFAAPQTLNLFRKSNSFRELLDSGVRFSPACCETIFETRMITGKPIITNSNKLRAYTTARYFEEQDLLKILVSGQVGG
jgi:predicted aconitase